jgi:hypothetical protein
MNMSREREIFLLVLSIVPALILLAFIFLCTFPYDCCHFVYRLFVPETEQEKMARLKAEYYSRFPF